MYGLSDSELDDDDDDDDTLGGFIVGDSDESSNSSNIKTRGKVCDAKITVYVAKDKTHNLLTTMIGRGGKF